MKALLSLLVASLLLVGCDRPSPPPQPSPTPAPTPVVIASPTPLPVPTPPPVPTLPRKPVELGKLFNGVTFKTKFATPESKEPASLERDDENSYAVEITFTAKLPRPSLTIEDIAANDPKLPEVLNHMPKLLETATVSPYFEKLYDNKISTIRQELFELDQVLSRHNFYDCETILQLKSPETGRKALLVIGDMDVNVDGSDGDRNVQVDDSGRFFQPQTSYRWPKTTDRPNPFIEKAQSKIAALKAEATTAGLSAQRKTEIQQAIQHQTRTIADLKSSSFLVSSADPSIVLPGFMLRDSSDPFSPAIGDYAAVIYNGIVYPAIVGDAGPNAKVGEASVRLCRQINPKASAASRSVSNIKVAYLVFPGTADKAAPPDLVKWREKTKQYLDEIGGTAPELFTWENNVPPWPTPTPTPTPTPASTPESTPAQPSPEVASPLLATPEVPADPPANPTIVTPPASQ
ncbi:MAG: glycoside hydrolase family 75 protein [Terrimicrobiaceae bacterium]